MNILIAEDEPLAAERLVNLLKQCDPSAVIVSQVDTVEDTIGEIRANPIKIDLLLLDIQLADGKSFRILEETKTMIPVIFTTAFDQYAIQAFKYHSIDYLLKPIQQKELMAALQKFNFQQQSRTPQELTSLRQIFNEFSKRYKERFVAKIGKRLIFIETEQAAFFFADGKAVYLVSAKDGKRYIIDYSLDEVESMLEPRKFFRISRKVIVNFRSISEVRGTNAKLEVQVSLPTPQELSVSRERATEFKQWLDQ